MTLVEFAAKVIEIYLQLSKERGRFAGPWVSFKDIAKRMEGKQRYGPWFRRWTESMDKLRWKSLDGWCFSFSPYWGPSKWNIWADIDRAHLFPGLGDHYLWLLDNEKYKAPPVEG